MAVCVLQERDEIPEDEIGRVVATSDDGLVQLIISRRLFGSPRPVIYYKGWSTLCILDEPSLINEYAKLIEISVAHGNMHGFSGLASNWWRDYSFNKRHGLPHPPLPNP